MKRQLFVFVMATILWYGHYSTVLASSNQPIEAFVQKIFLHGVPFNKALELKSSANIKFLTSKLETDCITPLIEKESPFCSNIVVTLGIIGGVNTDAVTAMKQYVEKQQLKLSLPHFRAKTSAVMALGYAINKNPNQTASDIALNVLKDRLWKIDWDDVIGKEETQDKSPELRKDQLKDKLRRSSVIGLGLSGNEEAREELERVLQRSDTKKDKNFKALVIEALHTLNTIITLNKAGKNGLACYYDQESPMCQLDIHDPGNEKPYETPGTQG